VDKRSEGKTYNEATSLVIYILLQRRLTQKLGGVGTSASGTNLIFHHGIADILNHAVELVHIFGAVQEPCDLASLSQRDQLLKNIVQLPIKS